MMRGVLFLLHREIALVCRCDNCSCLRSALTSGRSGLLDDEVKKLCTTNLSLFGASQSRSVVQMDSEGKG